MKITINQLRQIIKEEVARSALMKEYFFYGPNAGSPPQDPQEPEDQFGEGDAAWSLFTGQLSSIMNPLTLVHSSMHKLISAFPNNKDLKSIRSGLLDQIEQKLPVEEQMKIIAGLEDEVRKALGFEGKGYY